MLKQLFDRLKQRLLLPVVLDRCQLCQQPLETGAVAICGWCQQDLPWLLVACPVCAEPEQDVESCPKCNKQQPAYTHSFVGCYYEPPLDQLIRQFKFAHQPHLAHALAQIWLQQCSMQTAAVDMLIPVPMFAAKQEQRGFNQAQVIAQLLSEHLTVPLVTNGLEKRQSSAAQHRLNAVDRAKNLQHAFCAQRNVVDGKTIALIDDVMTTGATLHACATELKRAGAIRVDNWVIARTPRGDH